MCDPNKGKGGKILREKKRCNHQNQVACLVLDFVVCLMFGFVCCDKMPGGKR